MIGIAEVVMLVPHDALNDREKAFRLKDLPAIHIGMVEADVVGFIHAQRRSRMTTIKLLSAGMIAAAMIATPALARDNHLTRRHATENANASDPGPARYVDGQGCVQAPRVGAFATAPWDGGNIPCEPGPY